MTGARENTFFITLNNYLKALGHVSAKFGPRLVDTTLKPALQKALVAQKGWTSELAANLLEHNEKDVLRWQNAELLQCAVANANAQGKGKRLSISGQISKTQAPDELPPQIADSIMKQIAAGAPLLGAGAHTRVYCVELWSGNWAAKLYTLPKSEERKIFEEVRRCNWR